MKSTSPTEIKDFYFNTQLVLLRVLLSDKSGIFKSLLSNLSLSYLPPDLFFCFLLPSSSFVCPFFFLHVSNSEESVKDPRVKIVSLSTLRDRWTRRID